MSETKPPADRIDALFAANDIDGAVAAALEKVKAKPGDLRARSRLVELLCFAGEWERADKQLDAAAALQPEAMQTISLLKQLVRADLARSQFESEGRAPEFLSPPPEHVKLRLAASIELRSGNAAAASEMLAKAETLRAPISGTCDGESFDDLRDLDDVLADVFEVLTPTGKYFWVAMDSVDSMEPSPPKSQIDLLWRPTQMSIRNGGPDGVVYLPCIYSASAAQSDATLKLGRATDWKQIDAAPNAVNRGLGLRSFLLGETERSVLELGTIHFTERSV